MSGELKEAPHSSHYKTLGIEPVEVIEMWGMGFHEGNALKYLARWRQKEGLKDLRKAIWYIERLIKLEEEANAKAAAEMEKAYTASAPVEVAHHGKRRTH